MGPEKERGRQGATQRIRRRSRRLVFLVSPSPCPLVYPGPLGQLSIGRLAQVLDIPPLFTYVAPPGSCRSIHPFFHETLRQSRVCVSGGAGAGAATRPA